MKVGRNPYTEVGRRKGCFVGGGLVVCGVALMETVSGGHEHVERREGSKHRNRL